MTRAFAAQQAVGRDNFSTNGFPEGDSLSRIALLVMSFSLHIYMSVYAPAPTQTWSYVDNLQILGNSTGAVQQAFLVMQTWAQLFGLRLDLAKQFIGPLRYKHDRFSSLLAMLLLKALRTWAQL